MRTATVSALCVSLLLICSHCWGKTFTLPASNLAISSLLFLSAAGRMVERPASHKRLS